MHSAELLYICASAFVAVFVLLILLAVVMRLIMILFPHRQVRTDAAVLAALTSVVTTLYPGTKVTKVEEKR